MTNDKLLKAIRDHVVDVDGDRYDDALIVRQWELAETQIATEHECIRKTFEIDVVKDQVKYAGPSDFFQMKFASFDGRRIYRQPFTDVIYMTGQKEGWARWGTDFFINILPDKNITDGLVFYYFAYPAAVTDLTSAANPTVPDMYHHALALMTSALVASIDEESGRASDLWTLYQNEDRRLRRLHSDGVEPGGVRSNYDPINGTF